MLENEPIEIPCTQCGHKIVKRVGELARATKHQTQCPGCGADITLDTEKFWTGIKDAEKALKDFTRRLGKIGR